MINPIRAGGGEGGDDSISFAYAIFRVKKRYFLGDIVIFTIFYNF